MTMISHADPPPSVPILETIPETIQDSEPETLEDLDAEELFNMEIGQVERSHSHSYNLRGKKL